MKQINEIGDKLRSIKKISRKNEDETLDLKLESFQDELDKLTKQEKEVSKKIKAATENDDRFEFEKVVVLKEEVEDNADDLLYRVDAFYNAVKEERKLGARIKRIPQKIEETSDEWSLASVIIKAIRLVYIYIISVVDWVVDQLPEKNKEKED